MTTLSRSLAFACVILLALSACGKKEEQPGAAGAGGPGANMPPPEVGVIVAKAGNVPLQQDTVGRLAAYRSADVRARVPGVLQKRVYDEGTDVKEGQVLFVIDPAQLRAALGQAKASLASAQANAANYKAAADRARQLLPQKFISRSDYDNALAAERSGSAAVQQAKAVVDSAELDLGYATVRSPIAGRAGKQQVTEGALVGQGTTTLLTTVDQIDPLYANFSMGVNELDQIRRLQADRAEAAEVAVVLPDGTPYPLKGRLDFYGDIVDPTTGAVSQRASIPNPDKVLLPGTYVTLKTTLGQIPNAYLIPQAAVQRDAKSAYTMVVGKDGNVARKDVVAERAQGSDWIVTKGLDGGEQVVVSGLQKVQAGKPAKATPWPPKEPAQGAAGAAPGQPGAKPAEGKAGDGKQDGSAAKQG